MIFVDTGPFLARYLKSDQYHQKSVAAWKKISQRRYSCFTSNFVLDEFFTLLARRAGYEFSAETARNIYTSKVLVILRPGREEELEAIELFRKYAGQKTSFTDCVSFILMQKHKLQRVFSFDSHFVRAGFKLL